MTTFQVRYKICCVKTWRLFPPLGVLAEHALQIEMAFSSPATEKNFQHGEDMLTNDEHDTSWESLQFEAAVTCTRKADESQINQTDWLIYQQAYFIGSRYRISFNYGSNKNDIIFTHIGR